MTRLIRSHTGFRRSMQMSAVQLFVFVEGQESDPYFYDRLCSNTLLSPAVTYRIIRADLIANSGGKQALLSFFGYLRTVNSLLDSFKGKRTGSIFYLDKDLDDVFHSKVFSDHVAYTRYYHVENYLFVEGDILEAASSAASLDRATLAPTIGNPGTWGVRKATLWKDWVTLCLFVETFRVRSRCNYSRSDSGVNVSPETPTDTTLLSQCTQELERNYRGADFVRDFRRVQRLVNRYYHRGKHDLIFKGKWYLRLLQSDIENAMAGQTFSSHGLPNALLASLRTTLDFNGRWADHLKAPLMSIASRV
jgi:hypothetical protein